MNKEERKWKENKTKPAWPRQGLSDGNHWRKKEKEVVWSDPGMGSKNVLTAETTWEYCLYLMEGFRSYSEPPHTNGHFSARSFPLGI